MNMYTRVIRTVSRTFRRLNRTLVQTWLRAVRSLSTILAPESGQGISEYLIILAVVVIAAIALATTFSGQLKSLWDSITQQLAAIG